ncbi:MAG: 3-deoxy-manno-octulosonate cytidylyltransferase [Bdellovibrionaceae bacterium]|nr:3-deoxy-manno-octulosonate cytidylyltransferase [Pseudobdellovibrionaceae bacterium]
MSRVIGVIPVRFGATRFPGKPLAQILGKPMVEWVLRGAAECKQLSEIIVATDHEGIADVVRKLGYPVAMTPSDLPSGSDRVWHAVKDIDCDVVLNIQGDEPLIKGETLDAIVNSALNDKNEKYSMWSLAHELTEDTLFSQQVAKVVLDRDDCALFFSRLPIPYSRKKFGEVSPAPCLKHIGIYGFRKKFLGEFCAQPMVPAEEAEGLEQLRALYLGAKIKMVKVQDDCWGVDLPQDVQKIEALLKKRGF